MCSIRVRSFCRNRIYYLQVGVSLSFIFFQTDCFILKRFIEFWFFYHDNGSFIMTMALLSWQWFFYHDNGSFIMTLVLLSRQLFLYHENGSFIMTMVLLSWQLFLYHDNGSFIMTMVLLSWQWFFYHDNGIILSLWKIVMSQLQWNKLFREMITTCQSIRIYAFERNNYKLIWEKCINYYNNFDFDIFTILFLWIWRTIKSLKFLGAS